MPRTNRYFYEFGSFQLDPHKHRLLQNGKPVHLSSKAFDALSVFVRNPGEMLERETLLEMVWAGSFVEDANLTVAISQLRKVLGRSHDGTEFIETIPRVGYRFVADVREVAAEPRPLLIEKRTLSQTVIEEEIIDTSDYRQTARRSSVPQLARSIARPAVASLIGLALISTVVLGAALYSSKAQPEKSNGTRLARVLSPFFAGPLSASPASAQTRTAEAHVLYLKGNYLWSRRGDHATRSVDYFRRAIALDPDFAPAYAALAALHSTTSNPSPEAEALVNKALQLDNSLSSAHATLGFIRMFQHWDWATAESELNLAIALDASSATAHHWKGVYLSLQGRLDEARAELQQALERDPLSPVLMADLGQLHYFAHEYDKAIDYCNQALALDNSFRLANEYLLDVYRARGNEKEAFEQWLKIYQPAQQAEVHQVFARSGLNGIFKRELDQANNAPGQAFGIARNHLRLGNNEEALRWIGVVFEGPKTHWHPYLNVDPLYDGIRNEPQFKALLQRMQPGKQDAKQLR